MRSLGMDVDNRQRARSLSSVPDLHNSHEAIATTGASSTGASPPETDSSSAEEAGGSVAAAAAAATASLALGRVYAAHSLPSHIWSLNGKWECFSIEVAYAVDIC